MADDKKMERFNILNLTVVALVALVAIVGVTAIVLNGHAQATQPTAGTLAAGTQLFPTDSSSASAGSVDTSGNARMTTVKKR